MPLLPKRLVSRLVGYLTRIKLPVPMNVWVNGAFARRYKINLEEAERPLRDYRSLNEFFTRHLKSGVRPVTAAFVHPADGVLTQSAVIRDGELIQAKGWNFSAADFIGDAELAKKYEGGVFATWYLCPTDYHRVHSPLMGLLYSAKHIPGDLWPVNEWSVGRIRKLFNLNERVVMNFRSPQGLWSLVMVGATNVGQIGMKQDPSIYSNRWLWSAVTDRRYEPEIQVQAGSEVGVFNMGSTVVCLFEKSVLSQPMSLGATRVGQKI